jgi:hypothetical protein
VKFVSFIRVHSQLVRRSFGSASWFAWALGKSDPFAVGFYASRL